METRVMVGTHIATRLKAYDFTDRVSGERVHGDSRRAFMLVDGSDGTPTELKFGQDRDSVALFDELSKAPFGTRIEVEAEINAEARGRQAIVTYNVKGISQARPTAAKAS